MTMKDLNNSPADELDNYYLEIRVKDYFFGIPVKYVRDVLNPHDIEPVPLAPKIVLGSLNLRGRIVTAIDIRVVLNLGNTEQVNQRMSVVIEFEDELYSFIIDDVGDVVFLDAKDMKSNPENLNVDWKEVCKGIFSLENKLLIVLDVSHLLPKKSNE